jgi:hypothetical protein
MHGSGKRRHYTHYVVHFVEYAPTPIRVWVVLRSRHNTKPKAIPPVDFQILPAVTKSLWLQHELSPVRQAYPPERDLTYHSFNQTGTPTMNSSNLRVAALLSMRQRIFEVEKSNST